MTELTKEIYDWLIEIEQNEAVKFLEDCEIRNFYVDTLFSFDDDYETQLSDVIIFVPYKKFKNLENFKSVISIIETTIQENAKSNAIVIRNFTWKAYVPEKNEKLKETSDNIIQILDQKYVDSQIKLMSNSMNINPHLSLGIAKELIETTCKFLLSKNGVDFFRDWDIQKLVKETNKVLDFKQFEIEENKNITNIAIVKILSGLANVIHGITELRNSFGSGHGHKPEFEQLDQIFVRLAVNSASDLALFYLKIYEKSYS